MSKNPGRGNKAPRANWVRTGGAQGDPSLNEGSDFNDEGAGVTLNIKKVGSDPNADVGSKQRPGAE